MITKLEAEAIVREHLNKLESHSYPLALNENETMELPFGWVFFYNTRKFFETGDFMYQLAGNGPIIVNRRDGALVIGLSNKSVESFIEEYSRAQE